MFERLSKPAKTAVMAGCGEAATRGEPFTEDVHLLIGCSIGRTHASSILRDAGATRSRIIELLDGLDDDTFDDNDVQALAAVGIDFTQIARAADDVFGEGALEAAAPSRRRGPTKRAAPLGASAKRVLAHALAETVNAGARRIEAEHLLLGVLHDPSPRCRALSVLLDLDYDAIRTRMNTNADSH
jgi:ATP-dependent Clp protease ATP-binding subunit ClpA